MYEIVTTEVTCYYINFDADNNEHKYVSHKNIQHIDLKSTAIEDDQRLKISPKEVIGTVAGLLIYKLKDLMDVRRAEQMNNILFIILFNYPSFSLFQ